MVTKEGIVKGSFLIMLILFFYAGFTVIKYNLSKDKKPIIIDLSKYKNSWHKKINYKILQ